MGYGLGKLASAESWTRYSGAALTDALVTESFEYSGVRGNVSTKTTTVALDGLTAASTAQAYWWRASGAVDQLGYPAGISGDEPARLVAHQYANGFLTSIPGYATTLTYHDNFALASVAHSNGVTDWVGQDPNRLGRPAALWTSGVASSEDWNSGAYLYDGSGNIRAIGGQRYRYDGVSRLVEAELRIPETSTTLFGVESFTYDAYGNLTSRETTEGGSTTTVNSPADATTNRLTGATSYDSEGNLTSWNGAQYGFDALGRMVRMQNGAEDWLFAYSSGGERLLQVDQGGGGDKRWTVRDVAGRVLREWVEPQGGSPAWERDWIYRGANLLATIDATTTRHLTLDHLGTPRLVTDPSGARLAFKAYWPYGREATDPNQDGLSKKFTGHERDGYDPSSTADDLDYMHARFANPGTGRFLSVDPLQGGIGRPQTLNSYSYVAGNPIRYLDAFGLCGVEDPNDPCEGETTVTAPFPWFPRTAPNLDFDPLVPLAELFPDDPAHWPDPNAPDFDPRDRKEDPDGEDDDKKKEQRKPDCGKVFRDHFKWRFKTTNSEIPGLGAPTGLSLLLGAGRTVANATGGVTLFQVADAWLYAKMSGISFTGATVSGTFFTPIQTFASGVVTQSVTAILVAGAFEGGVAAGSAASALGEYINCKRNS